MRFKELLLSTACLALACVMHVAAAAGAPESAKDCSNCHGDNGVSTRDEIPTIAGMSAFYLEGQMQSYQNDKRPCPKVEKTDKSGKSDMCEVAKKLNAAQVKEVASYFAGEKFMPAKQPVDAALAAKGKAIHEIRCESCHSDGGSEADDDAGILAGQWKGYIMEAFKEFSEGKRPQPEKMKPKTKGLTDADYKALAEFYAGQGK